MSCAPVMSQVSPYDSRQMSDKRLRMLILDQNDHKIFSVSLSSGGGKIQRLYPRVLLGLTGQGETRGKWVTSTKDE